MSKMFYPYMELEVAGNCVGLTTCKICGATIIIDPCGALEIHKAWHEINGEFYREATDD